MKEHDIKIMAEYVVRMYSFLILRKGRMSGSDFAKNIADNFECEAYDPNLRNIESSKNYEAYNFAMNFIKEIEATCHGVEYSIIKRKTMSTDDLIKKFKQIKNKKKYESK